MSQVNALTWLSLTATVNTVKSPNQFLKKLLFPVHDAVPTETIEIGLFTREREAAPFVRKNGEAIMVGGVGQTSSTVEAPNIRIKRPFPPSPLLFNRLPGTIQYATSGDQLRQAAELKIARDMAVMADMITNAEELMCAGALQGQIVYAVEDQEVFQITFPRPSNCNISASVFWDDADPTLPRPLRDLMTAKTAISDNVGPAPTDVILGSEAGAAFLNLVESGNFKLITQLNYAQVGDVTFTSQFQDDGAIYLGTISGLRIWQYGRTCLVNGVATSMIRPKYAEVVSVSPAADRVLYYGAIPDADVLDGMLFQGERFAKSWRQPDPSALISLAHSRPLPVMRRPGAWVSIKVVSG